MWEREWRVHGGVCVICAKPNSGRPRPPSDYISMHGSIYIVKSAAKSKEKRVCLKSDRLFDSLWSRKRTRSSRRAAILTRAYLPLGPVGALWRVLSGSLPVETFICAVASVFLFCARNSRIYILYEREQRKRGGIVIALLNLNYSFRSSPF